MSCCRQRSPKTLRVLMSPPPYTSSSFHETGLVFSRLRCLVRPATSLFSQDRQKTDLSRILLILQMPCQRASPVAVEIVERHLSPCHTSPCHRSDDLLLNLLHCAKTQTVGFNERASTHRDADMPVSRSATTRCVSVAFRVHPAVSHQHAATLHPRLSRAERPCAKRDDETSSAVSPRTSQVAEDAARQAAMFLISPFIVAETPWWAVPGRLVWPTRHTHSLTG